MNNDHKTVREALEYCSKACQCSRFKTKGFDYGQKHPTLGVAGEMVTIYKNALR